MTCLCADGNDTVEKWGGGMMEYDRMTNWVTFSGES